MDVQPERPLEQRLAGSAAPYAATTTDVGVELDVRRRAARAGAPGSRAARPPPSPAARRAGGRGPRGRSGRVSSVRDVVPRGEPLEHVRAERAPSRRRRAAPRLREREPRAEDAERLPAALVVVRSRISTPSRWSSSCCTTRAASSSSSSRNSLAALVARLDASRATCRSTGHEHALEREAALVGDLASPRCARRSAG